MAIHAILLAALLTGQASGDDSPLSYQETFVCELKEGANLLQIHRISAEWQKTVRGLEGGEGVTVRVARPVYSDDLTSFTWTSTAPSRTAIGRYMDSYPESMKEIDRRFYELADCISASFWEVREFR